MIKDQAEAAGASVPLGAGRVAGMERAALAAGILVLIFLALRVFAFVHDDAFITFRYAWHLRHGYGPVFNPGDHTEGFSCPLYMALTAVLMFLPGDVLIRAKLLGVVFAACAIVAVWKLARELDLPAWARVAAPLLLGANPSFALSAVDAMETSLQALLLSTAVLYFVRERNSGRGWASAVFLTLAALNRAEGVIFLVVAFALVILQSRGKRLARRDQVWALVAFSPVILYLLWRHSYYGWWMPNTYYAKNLPLESAFDISMGPAYAIRTVFMNLNGRAALAAASILFWLAALAGAGSDRLKRRRAMVVPLFVGAQLVVALRAGGDWMQGWRYMSAVVPLWTLLIVTGLAEPESALDPARKKLGMGLGLAGCGIVLSICCWAAVEYHDPSDGMVSWWEQHWASDARGLLRNYRMENTLISADILNSRLPEGSTVAFSEVGAVPYFTPKLRWIDTYGLVDSHIAHLTTIARFRTGITGDYTSTSTTIGREIRERRPDFIIRWHHSDYPEMSILDGAYIPAFRAPVKPLFGKPEAIVLQVWKRAR